MENPQKQDHGLPEEGAHGLALPNPSPTLTLLQALTGSIWDLTG